MDRAGALRAVLRLEAVANRSTHAGEATAARNRATHLRAKFNLSDTDVVNADNDGFARFNYYMVIRSTYNGIKTTLDHTKRQIDTLNLRDRADAAARLYRELHELMDLDRYPPSLKKWRDEAIRARYQAELAEYLTRWVSDDKPELDNLYSRATAHDFVLNRMSDSYLRKDTIETAVGVKSKVLWGRYLKVANNQEKMTSTPEEGTA